MLHDEAKETVTYLRHGDVNSVEENATESTKHNILGQSGIIQIYRLGGMCSSIPLEVYYLQRGGRLDHVAIPESVSLCTIVDVFSVTTRTAKDKISQFLMEPTPTQSLPNPLCSNSTSHAGSHHVLDHVSNRYSLWRAVLHGRDNSV